MLTNIFRLKETEAQFCLVSSPVGAVLHIVQKKPAAKEVRKDRGFFLCTQKDSIILSSIIRNHSANP